LGSLSGRRSGQTNHGIPAQQQALFVIYHPIAAFVKFTVMTTVRHLPTLRSQAHCKAHKADTQKPTLQRAYLHPRCPGSISLFILTLLASGLTNIYGQTPNSLTTFNRPTLSQLIQLPQTPQPATFQRIDIDNFSRPTNQPTQLYSPNPILGGQNSIQQQNQQIIEQTERYQQIREQQLAEVRNNLAQEEFYRKHMEWMAATKSYQQAFKTLSGFNPDSFSISKAVFTIENAFFNNKYNYAEFENVLKQTAQLVKQILKRENLSAKSNTALNYGIMKLYQQKNTYYNPKTKQTINIKPLQYDFDDFLGKKDYTKMFAIKLLSTGKGQCHSLPLLYLMIAEQLGAKAYLSLAPQHSFIQFVDYKGNILNFETTNGNLVSSNWLLQSGYINSNALKSKIYLDTLSQRKLYAQCLADLLLGYESKFGYDNFAEQIRQKIMQVNPDNMTANIIESNIKLQLAAREINAVGKPDESDLPNYPKAYQAYLNMQAAYDKVENLAADAYQRWLKSIEQEKKKQESKEVQEKMKREIEYLKKIKVTITDRTRD